MRKCFLLFATLLVIASCGSNSGVTFNPAPEMKGSLAKYYDVKDVTLNILRDKEKTDLLGQPQYVVNVTFTIVKNDVTGIENEWSSYDGTLCCNTCSSWPPTGTRGKYLWGIGFTIEDESHNEVVTIADGETPGGGKLLEYCITPGQEYKYVWNCNMSSVIAENKYKAMTKIYDGEMKPNFHILVGQNVWSGRQEDAPETYYGY